tara:strand:+ start:1477 stop:1752 length:276 start_codon:yes stop_codon:yes gene_type:complete
VLDFPVSTELIIGDIDMSWNASYTRQKQKEMTEKAIFDSENKKTWGSPIVYYSTHQRKMKQERHDKICWCIGYCILGIITGLFIWLFIGIM